MQTHEPSVTSLPRTYRNTKSPERGLTFDSTMSNTEKPRTQIQPLVYTKAQLPAILGLSKATIDRMRKDKEFPEAIVLCKNKVGWPVEVVKQWIAQRPAATGIY